MPLGKTQSDIVKPNPTDLNKNFSGFRAARVIKVYDADFVKSATESEKVLYGKADIVWLDGISKVPKAVSVCRPWFSWKRGAGIFFMPEVDDIVVCQNRENGYPIIIGSLPYRWNEALNSPEEITDSTVGSIQPLYKGEVLLKSSSQAEVLLSKNGTIRLKAKDPTKTESITTLMEENCTEQYFSKVLSDNTSTVAETTLGYAESETGALKSCGSSAQILETASVSYTEETLVLPANKSNTFILTDNKEIDHILGVSIINTTNNNTTILKSEQYTLGTEYLYTPSSLQVNEAYFKPCSSEKNIVKYTLTIDYNFKEETQISLNVIIRKVLGAVRLNTEGDLFLDGRNVIIRSNSGAALQLTEDGDAKLQGLNTLLGNSLEGKITLNKTGIKKELGNYSDASETIQDVKNTATKDSPKYFYIEDSLPLFCSYFVSSDDAIAGGSTGWVLEGVDIAAYNLMSMEDKNSVERVNLTILNDSYLINSTSVLEIIQKGFPSYASLKAGV